MWLQPIFVLACALALLWVLQLMARRAFKMVYIIGNVDMKHPIKNYNHLVQILIYKKRKKLNVKNWK